MAININGKAYNEDELKVLEKAGLLHIGEKHDTSSTTPSAQALHGVFPGNANQYGVFTYPGVRPGMFNATSRPRGITSIIPMFKTDILNEIVEIMTGVTAGSGTNSTSSCATAPKAGDLKTCQQTNTFGIIHIGMRVDDVTQMGMRKNRADVPREIYNNAAADNPWLPQIPGIDGISMTSERLRAASYTLGIEMERQIAPVQFAGVAGTEDNTYRGIARQWNGLDSYIKTGYTDAVTGQACSAADSDVVSFNAEISGTDSLGRTVVEAFTDTLFGRQEKASSVGLAGVQWGLVMRPDLFRSLTEQWACTYATYRCSGTSTEPVNQDALSIYNTRVGMYNGNYLLIDGVQVPVITDDSIPRDTLGNNHYKSDVYGVALSWAGRPLLFGEYADMGNAEAEEFISAFGMPVSETTVINNGLYRVFKRVTKGCYEYDFYGKVRLWLDAPFLSFRIDDLRYNSYHKQPDPIPGWSYYVDGGLTYRT